MEQHHVLTDRTDERLDRSVLWMLGTVAALLVVVFVLVLLMCCGTPSLGGLPRV